MPWNKVNLVDQRKELVEEILLGKSSVVEICKSKGVSCKTAYKWLRRYAESGLGGLQDESKARHFQENKTAGEVEDIIIKAHMEYPYWGPRKLRNLLLNEGVSGLPSVTTFARVLERNDCEVKKNNRSEPAKKRFEREKANSLWQMDFKGSFMLETHRCYPLTIIDDHSRFSIALQACKDEQTQTVKSRLIKTFERFGLPDQINVDNGNPWGKSDLESYTQLAVWMIKLDVKLSHSAPYHPQTNGKDERFHRTLKLEVLNERKYKNEKDIQYAFDEWQHIYNFVRPHDALNGKTPSSRYETSQRMYSEKGREFEYDRNDTVRKVQKDNGMFSFAGKHYKAGKALGGEYICIKETTESSVFSIFFMDTFIRKFSVSLG